MPIRDEHNQKVQGGSEHVLYKGLLAMAHERWRSGWSLEARITEYPSAANGQTTFAEATVTTPDEMRFTEMADANAQNTNKMIAPHAPRMALTRAKGRALRDALNIGEAMFEELGGEEPAQP